MVVVVCFKMRLIYHDAITKDVSNAKCANRPFGATIIYCHHNRNGAIKSMPTIYVNAPDSFLVPMLQCPT